MSVPVCVGAVYVGVCGSSNSSGVAAGAVVPVPRIIEVDPDDPVRLPNLGKLPLISEPAVTPDP